MSPNEEYLPPAVRQIEQSVLSVLERARQDGKDSTIQQSLALQVVQPAADAIVQQLQGVTIEAQANVVLETAARRIFYRLVDGFSIDQPEAPSMWTLLDVLLLLSELRQTGRAIVWYLVEELVESQTADQCRLVFDYLDERRDRLTQREFQVTHLIILRTCNELLRRLSRAEDAIFCGRVFFFLFQIFPLGEQSSVNLRGEFHTDNVTVFDAHDEVKTQEAMVVDDPSGTSVATRGEEGTAPTPGKQDASDSESFTHFYAVFWNLQRDFSMPTRLIDNDDHFSSFKVGLEDTIKRFAEAHVVKTKLTSDGTRGVKRKRGEEGSNEYAGKYNPKYLTSKDLFSLELSDLSFQRNILVQALILLDFLLSLSEQAQKKLDGSGIPRQNTSVNYNFVLPEDKREWAQATRGKIATYLQQGPDGNFYYRMVNTVLARDKNWIWWKIQRCPPIVKDAIATTEYETSKERVRQTTANRRIKARPMGAMDLTFLETSESARGLDSLKVETRLRVPSTNELVSEMATKELDLDFATETEQEEIKAGMDGISWRIVRNASRTALSKFDLLGNQTVVQVFAAQPQVTANGGEHAGALTSPSKNTGVQVA